MAQRITCVNLNDGHNITVAALAVEIGRTYRITGTVDTANVPLGTPIEFRISHTLRGVVGGDTAERGLQGQTVVYADGMVQNIDIRWTNFTVGDAYLVSYLTGDFCGRDGNFVRPGVRPNDYIVVDDLDFQPFDDTLWNAALDATTTTTELRKAGAVFVFNRAVRAGLYATRDLWFRDTDPGNATSLRITRIEPEWFRQNVTLTPTAWRTLNGDTKNTATIRPSATPTSTSMGFHGTEINPWRDGWEWRPNVGSIPNVTAFEDRLPDMVYQPRRYDGDHNLDPGNTGRPIEPVPGDTIVKCLSYVEPPARGENGTRSRVAAYIPVTCVAADIPAGSFRPYPGAADKTPKHNISDLDLSLLPGLPSPAAMGGRPRWNDAARMAYYMQPAQIRQFPPNEGIVQSLASSVYSRPHTEETSSHFAAGLLTDAFTPEQKTRLAYAVVQYGLDLYHDNLIRKIAWAESGGKLCKKPYAVLAAVLLNDATMKATISASSRQYDVTENAGKPRNECIYPWYEETLFGAVTASNITEMRTFYQDRQELTGVPPTYRGAMRYFPENFGMPSVQDSASPWVPWDSTAPGRFGNPPGQNFHRDAYRHNGTTRALPAILMMHVVPGARAVFNNEVTLRWYDLLYRYQTSVTEQAIAANRTLPPEQIPTYHAALWKAYRSGGKPVPVGRFGLNDEVNYSFAEAATIMNPDFLAQFGRPMVAADFAPRMPLDGIPRMRTFPMGQDMSFPLAAEWHVKPAGGTFLDPLSVPTSYAITSGTLPAGLELDAATGVIRGTPTEPSPLRPDLPKRTADPAVRATDVMVAATNARGSSAQLIRFAVVQA